MNFLPQGYSFESYSNPYQSQFISPFYGSGQYGRQYSPMAQNGPRLPTCQPGTCPPWLPPGIIATPSSGVQELSVLMDPTLSSRMARAYNNWTIAYWGKPDNPAWLWPDGASTQPVPPNVFCDAVPVPPGGGGGGGGGRPRPPQLTPGPAPGPQLTPGPTVPPSSTPGPSGPTLTPGTIPKSSLTPGPSGPQISSMPAPSSYPPEPNPWRRANPGVPQCGGAGNKGACFRCCTENSTSKSQRQQCLNQCVALPDPKPKRTSISRLAVARRRANGRMARSMGRRLRKGAVPDARAVRARRATGGWTAVPGDTRGWCGAGEHLCTKKAPNGKSNFCCCRDGSSECAGGKSVLAAF
jgi:hypothetical protein